MKDRLRGHGETSGSSIVSTNAQSHARRSSSVSYGSATTECTLYDGVIAPPAMLQAWTMRGLRPPTAEEVAYAEAQGEQKMPLEGLDDALVLE